MEIIIIPLLTLVVFLLLFVLLTFCLFAFDVFLDLPYVATERKKIATIIKLAAIRKGQTVVDLGSGDGRLLISAAQKGAFATGYEINPLLIALTKIKAHLRGVPGRTSAHLGGEKSHKGSVNVLRQNLWKADLATADVVFVYGRKKNMERFQEFVYQNAKKGTRIIVNTNSFPTKRPIKSENGIFLYKI